MLGMVEGLSEQGMVQQPEEAIFMKVAWLSFP
jgi:hypothetical protein